MSNYLDLCKQHNIPVSANVIGSSGENIAKAILEYFPIFKVVFLGEKFPIVDFYVEIDEDNKSYPFLVQVKATTSDLTKRKYLRVSVPKVKYGSLHKKPIPTYVGGVHIDSSTLYITPTITGKEKLSSIAPKCILSLNNQEKTLESVTRIKHDVIAYWDCLNAFEKKMEYNSVIL